MYFKLNLNMAHYLVVHEMVLHRIYVQTKLQYYTIAGICVFICNISYISNWEVKWFPTSLNDFITNVSYNCIVAQIMVTVANLIL